MPETRKTGWLENPAIRKLMLAVFMAWLVGSVGLDLIAHRHGHFAFENFVGFWAVFGLLACLLLVYLAKFIRLIIKRPQDYYDD
jgi:hypothetical protein